jgi:hypothetical protein
MAPIADDDDFSRRFRRYAIVAAFVFDADQEFTVFTCWGELKPRCHPSARQPLRGVPPTGGGSL